MWKLEKNNSLKSQIDLQLCKIGWWLEHQ